jgi:hypothetical protein
LKRIVFLLQVISLSLNFRHSEVKKKKNNRDFVALDETSPQSQGFLNNRFLLRVFLGCQRVATCGSLCVCVCERFASIQPKSLLQMDWNGCRQQQQQKRMSSASSRILTMLSVVLLVLATGLAAAATSSEEDDGSSTPPFTDQWAVHISGGDQVADAIAARHGFTNLGKVKKFNFFSSR